MDNNIQNMWTDDIEDVLDRIRNNSAILSTYHKNEYYKYKGFLKYFRIPTIVFSAVGSVASVGLRPYLNQNTISITTCFIGLSVGILNSIELFLSIQSTMEKSLSNSKDYYLLAIDIKKILLLDRDHRIDDGRTFLEEKYNSYCELIKSSELINKDIEDKLLPLEKNGINIIKIINNRRKKKKNKKINLNDLNNKYNELNNIIQNLENNENILMNDNSTLETTNEVEINNDNNIVLEVDDNNVDDNNVDDNNVDDNNVDEIRVDEISV